MEYRIATRIDEFPEEVWDRLVGDNSFSRYRFVRCLERARSSGVKMWHVMFYKNGSPCACTSLFTHPFELDLIAPLKIRNLTRRFKRISEFLATEILFCGLPISLGRSHFGFSPGVQTLELEQIFAKLNEVMENLAKEGQIHLLGAKEFDRRGLAADMDEVSHAQGYVRCHSLDTTTLSIEWDSWAEYLASLRSNYRHQILGDLSRAAKAKITWQRERVTRVDPQILFRLYYNVFARAENRLEMVTPEFFSELGRLFPSQTEVLMGMVEGRVVAYALVFEDESSLTFMFAGLDYHLLRPLGLYQNLLIQLVKMAIDRRKCILELGQTSYAAKQRLGAVTRPLVFYLKDRYWFHHRVLKALAPVFFPEVLHARRNVFRKDPNHPRLRAPGNAPVSGGGQEGLSRGSQLDSAA